VPRVGNRGYPRREFTTLEPDVPFESNIVVLSGNSDAWLKRVTGNALSIALRPYEVWWKWGTVDEVFDGTKRFGPSLGGYTTPLKLECRDVLTLCVVGRGGVDERDVEVISGLEITRNPRKRKRACVDADTNCDNN
jgi:hypothetical protein